MSAPRHYTLPSSPNIKCQDRFSLLEDEEDVYEVRFWDIFQVILQSPVSSANQIIEILDTIAVTLRDGQTMDYGGLKQVLEEWPNILQLWPTLVQMALKMPELFPGDCISILTTETPVLMFSREQVCCLVVHQFFCTLRAPVWQDGYQDFDLWYSKEQPHDRAATIYLNSLLTYFSRCATLVQDGDWKVSYSLRVLNDADQRPHRLIPLEIVQVSEVSTCEDLVGLSGNACVVSANRYVGFGQSATQEEIFVGTCPEACPIVLVTPPLEDNQVLIVKGAEGMVETEGQRRDIRVVGPYRQYPDVELHQDKWRNRTMLFMDALELDLAEGDGLADLLPANVRREKMKALNAFTSGEYGSVSVGFWGCGAFNGDAEVKMLILWCAASAAGTTLRVVCDEGQRKFGKKLEDVVGIVVQKAMTAQQLESILLLKEAGQLAKGEMFSFLMDHMSSTQQ
ncbi:hypothetical protein FH972_026098 [Carpinus fangiana]|uniref:poly(ADP-ribose) glycohydrolase n=1 Tax=Carpinus fangiana TaxID=176857 RepID=A0A5N6L2Y4_9ROSI|nr:hypothetical protein FH972_026098 [Carpinus fangiana]